MKPVLSVFLSHVEPLLGGSNARLIDMARIAEQAGAGQGVFSEHVAMGPKDGSALNGALTGEASRFPFEPDENYPEPLVALSAIAGATQTLRLATGILIAPLRPAILLAKMAATLDHLSNGRFDLGVGSGWHVPELRATGIDPDRTVEHMENIVGACRALWRGEPASFASSTVNFDRLQCRPAPFAREKFPVWIAGPPSAGSARRIARLGNGWLAFSNVRVDGIRQGADHLRAAERQHGLAEGSLGIRAGLPVVQGRSVDEMLDGAFADAPALVAAGAGFLQLALWRYVRRFDEIGPVIEKARQRLDAL